MMKSFEYVSVEHVCSGIGIPNIYGYLRDVERIAENPDVAALIAAAADPSVTIIHHALRSEDRCKVYEQLKRFGLQSRLLAHEAPKLHMGIIQLKFVAARLRAW